MSSLLRAMYTVLNGLKPVEELWRPRGITCYEPEPMFGPTPVIQYWQPVNEAYVRGVKTEPPGDTTYDNRTGIIRSYTATLDDSNVSHLQRLTDDHLTDTFIGTLNRFTTSYLYEAPTLPSEQVHLVTEDQRTTLEQRLSDRAR